MVELTTEGLQEIADHTEVDSLTEVEKEASDSGWSPQDQWEGKDDEWVSAKEYLRVGEMMDRIKSQGSQIRSYTKKMDQLEEALQTLGEHNKKIAEEEYSKALTDLKSLKVEAMEVGDYDTVVEIDDRLGDLKQTNPANQPSAETNPLVEEWLTENTWYESNPIMRGAADAMMQQVTESTPGIEPNKVLSSVLETMKEEFPHKFGGTKGNQYRVTTTEVGLDGTTRARTTQSSNKFTARQLNEEQTRIGRTFVRTGALESLEEYAKQLGAIGELDVQVGEA